jgi:hypothetical protein
MSSPLVAHLMNAAPADVPSLLAEDVRFRSPFAEYEGRDTIARLFAVMPAVFDELALVRELRGDDREVAAVLRGRIGDEPVDVIVDERYAIDGRVSEAMLVTRPLVGTKAAIRRMGALLEATKGATIGP